MEREIEQNYINSKEKISNYNRVQVITVSANDRTPRHWSRRSKDGMGLNYISPNNRKVGVGKWTKRRIRVSAVTEEGTRERERWGKDEGKFL